MDDNMNIIPGKKALALTVLLGGLFFSFGSQAEISDEVDKPKNSQGQQAKVISYVLNLLQWSNETLENDSFNYCTLSPSSANLLPLNKVTFHKKPVKVINLETMSQVKNQCHSLHITPPEDNDFEEILTHFHNKPILLISDSSEFARRGGHISLFKLNNKLAFTMNVPSLEKSGFSVNLNKFTKLIVEPLPNEI